MFSVDLSTRECDGHVVVDQAAVVRFPGCEDDS